MFVASAFYSFALTHSSRLERFSSEMDLLLMPKNSGRLQLVQWPLFLLSSKVSLLLYLLLYFNSALYFRKKRI